MALTLGEIESARASLDSTLGEPGIAVIEERTLVADGLGGGTETWAAVGTAPCRWRPTIGDEELRGGAISAVGKGIVTFPAETAVVPENRLQIGGTAYSVLDVEIHSWDLCVRATCEIPDFGG